MKTTVIVGAVIIVILSVLYFILPAKPATAPIVDTIGTPLSATSTIATSTITTPTGDKIKTAKFSGIITAAQDKSAFDGEFFITVNGKHITVGGGMVVQEVGSFVTDLPAADLLGKQVDIYAKDNGDDTYTIFGSKDFYAKVINTGSTSTTTPPKPITPPGPKTEPVGKIKAANFTGTLEKVHTGCFSDGECYVVVDGKHITLIMGRSQEEVGSIIGVPSIGDLEPAIGAKVEVYAKDNLDGTYTLYGSKGFYIKVLSPNDKPISSGSCVVGGCSSQLCIDPSKDQGVTTCEYSAKYACYKTAECKRQASGQCGWTETTDLKQCLSTAS